MITIKDLRLTYRSDQGEFQAVRGVSLTVKAGEFYTLLGPSGCGKTSTLRCVAGLETPDSGEIIVGDQIVFSSERGIAVPPNRRQIGMVFQSYAIWPHMTVFQNVAFPLRYVTPHPGKAEIRDRVAAALDLVHLGGLQDRPAPFLSGGQQQRLALARALVGEPRVLLLDEPLSNLDAKLREEMRFEIRELVKRLKVTTLFVTHEQIEALEMSDLMGPMNEGRIVQEGTPEQIYGAPQTAFVAEFIGKMNFVPGRVLRTMEDRAGIETALGILDCRARPGLAVGAQVTVAIRPENLAIDDGPEGSDATPILGAVTNVTYQGNFCSCQVSVGDRALNVQLHPQCGVLAGSPIRLRLLPDSALAILADP